MVEIIPKPAAKIPLWLNILFYFSIILLIGLISSYFVFNHFIKKSETALQNLEESLAKEKTSETQLLEKEILSYQKKIEDVDKLLTEHKLTSKVFEFLEKISHPKIQFSKFDFNLTGSQARVSGVTENFQTLGQQLLLLKKESLIKEVNLSEISLGKGEEVSFSLLLLLDPQIFKK